MSRLDLLEYFSYGVSALLFAWGTYYINSNDYTDGFMWYALSIVSLIIGLFLMSTNGGD